MVPACWLGLLQSPLLLIRSGARPFHFFKNTKLQKYKNTKIQIKKIEIKKLNYFSPASFE
jgi:hypothetical protein